MHTGHGISWRFALSAWGKAWKAARLILRFPSKVSFTDCSRIITVSRDKEGLAQGCLLQAMTQGFRVCISYPDSLFHVAHPRDLLSLSLHCLPTLVPVSLSSFLQASKSQLLRRLGSSPPVMTANYEMSCQRLPFYLISYSPAKLSNALWKEGKGSVSAAPAASLIVEWQRCENTVFWKEVAARAM